MSILENRLLIEKLLKLRNKRGELVKFKLNSAQDYYWQKKTRRNLVLKARQKGLSKIIDADQLIDCLKKPTNAVVISHEREATSRLFEAVKGYIDGLEVKPVVSIDSKSALKFPKRGSSYFIGTAGQRAFGRGDTIHRAHLSECSFYNDLEKILAGISEACEYGQIDLETTPNGRDEFYTLWQKARSGLSPYTCIFIPWFIDLEYSVQNMTEKEKAGLSESVQKMFAIPDDDFVHLYTDEENLLISRVFNEHGFLLLPGQIKWRRYKIWDKGSLFFQEYPEDEVSCFLQTGRSVFSHIICDPSLQVPLDNIALIPPAKLAELKGRTLFAGVDGAEGTANGDRHCFAVIDAPADVAQAKVIFEIANNDPIDIFWLKVKRVLDEFNIQLAVEKNGVGVAHCRMAETLGVQFEEFITGAPNRPIMVSEYEESCRKEEIIESYPEAENEARDMVYISNDRAEARQGKHDDRMFARFIAWQIRKRPAPSITFF